MCLPVFTAKYPRGLFKGDLWLTFRTDNFAGLFGGGAHLGREGFGIIAIMAAVAPIDDQGVAAFDRRIGMCGNHGNAAKRRKADWQIVYRDH